MQQLCLQHPCYDRHSRGSYSAGIEACDHRSWGASWAAGLESTGSCFGILTKTFHLGARECWMIYRGPGFNAVVWSGSTITPSPISNLSLFLHLPMCFRSSLLPEERGGGEWGRSQIIWWRESLVLWFELLPYSYLWWMSVGGGQGHTLRSKSSTQFV